MFVINAISHATNAISHVILHAINVINAINAINATNATNLSLKYILKNSSFAPILKSMWQMQRIAARHFLSSGHYLGSRVARYIVELLTYFQAGQQKANEILCGAMTLNLLKSDDVER